MGEPFKGTINVDIRDSVPDWAPDWAPFEPPKAPDGAPSVVYIVLDDVGFSAMGCYGGPIETPNIDRIAAEGVRFTQWHTTALCSPTRKSPEEGYHFTEDITDRAIEFIKDAKAAAPDKPFFLYYAPGAAHAPHHAPREWIDRYRGRFDLGYEAIREQILARQRQMGIVPANTELPPLNPIGTRRPARVRTACRSLRWTTPSRGIPCPPRSKASKASKALRKRMNVALCSKECAQRHIHAHHSPGRKRTRGLAGGATGYGKRNAGPSPVVEARDPRFAL